MSHIKILSIDGGGIRGILPGQILVSLETKLQQKSGNANARIADYFDMLAGTSTGGILTCMMLCPDKDGRPKFSAQQAVDLYLKKGTDIFSASIMQKIKSAGGLNDEKYSAEALEKNLKDYLGDIRLSELLKPCLITSYDITGRQSFFLRSHIAKKRKAANDLSYDFYLREVARATAAAPTYFEPALVKSMAGITYPLIDGGVFANNPSLCAYAEARQFFESYSSNNISGNKKATLADMFMVSIGTGSKEEPYKYDDAKNWGALKWVKPILDIMMGGVAETVDYQVEQMFDAVGKKSTHYHRIKPEIKRAVSAMDDASAKNLDNLRQDGIESAIASDAQLDKIADFLIADNKHAIA
jgi:patatin-like phospholipase/acyl hydrolase